MELKLIKDIIAKNESEILKYEQQLQERKENNSSENGNYYLEGIIEGIKGVNDSLKKSIEN